MIALRQFINSCINAVGLGKPNWTGDGGVFSIRDGFEDLAQAIIDRGVIQVGDTTALALIGGADSQFALVPDVGYYGFNPNNDGNAPVGSVPANGGGLWMRYFSFVPPSGSRYSQAIGNGSDTEFTIIHNLNTMTPTVLVIETAFGTPQPALNPKNYDWEVVDLNTVTITISGGASIEQYTVTVKK